MRFILSPLCIFFDSDCSICLTNISRQVTVSEVLLRSTINGIAFVLFRYQRKPGSHSQKCHTGTLSTTTDDTLSTPWGLCSDQGL